jgi:hypothetical protein
MMILSFMAVCMQLVDMDIEACRAETKGCVIIGVKEKMSGRAMR